MKATLQRHTTNICTTLLTNPDVFRLAVHCLQTEHTRQKTHQKTHCRELVAAVCVSGVKIGKRDHHIDLHCSHLSFPCPTITASCRSMQSSRFHLAAESVRRSAESMGRNTESPPKAARTRKYTPPATATVSKQAGHSTTHVQTNEMLQTLPQRIPRMPQQGTKRHGRTVNAHRYTEW